MEELNHKHFIDAYANQLDNEKYAVQDRNDDRALAAVQGHAMRCLIAHGFLGIIDAIDGLSTEVRKS